MIKKNIKKIILLLITLIFLYFVFANLDYKELFEVIKDFNPLFLILFSLSALSSFSCRAICFKILMSKTAKLPLKTLIPLCITGASLNVILPARAGDIFRAFFIGQKYNINKLKVFGTVMLERMFDTFVIFCFLTIAVTLYHKNQLAIHLCTFAGIIMVVFATFAFVAFKYNKADTICNFLIKQTSSFPFAEHLEKFITFINNSCNNFFNGFEIMESPKKLIRVILTSFCIWSFECLNFYILICGFGYHLHWSITLFILSFIALACMIPSTSIFIGPYQMAVIAAFAIYDVGKETALAITLVQQTSVIILTTVIAGIFLIKNNISYKELKSDINTKIE